MENNQAVDTQATETQVNGQEQQQVEMFTKEQMDAFVQSETDRKVTKALQTAKEKWTKEYEEKLAQEKSEAERLANMTSEQRKAEELKKMQDAFDLERNQFNEAKKQFEMERLTLEVTKQLANQNIPVEFAEWLVDGEGADKTKAKMDVFTEKWNTLLQQEIETRVNDVLKGNAPKQASNSNKVMTKSEFARLPYSDRQRMLKESPELVQQILNQ